MQHLTTKYDLCISSEASAGDLVIETSLQSLLQKRHSNRRLLGGLCKNILEQEFKVQTDILKVLDFCDKPAQPPCNDLQQLATLRLRPQPPGHPKTNRYKEEDSPKLADQGSNSKFPWRMRQVP